MHIVISRGSRANIIAATMKKRLFRKIFTVFEMSENMRIGQDQSCSTLTGVFSNWEIGTYQWHNCLTVFAFNQNIYAKYEMIPALASGNHLGTFCRRHFPSLLQTSMLQSNNGSLDIRKGDASIREQLS